MSRKQAFIIKKYIDEMLDKDYIKFNISFYAAFIFIVKKFNKELRFYVNYRALNALIIFNRNVSSLIKKTFVKLCAIKIYNKFDIIIVFNEIRIRKNYEKKTTFLIKYDLYEYMIMSFDLYNASVTFQVFINDVLREYLNVFYIAYFNDILIYSNIKKKHLYHINKILNKLQKIELYLNINKCDFHIIRVKYLDLIIIIDEIEINFKKIKIII